MFKTSQFVCLALFFLINSKLAFSLIVSQRCPAGTAKNVWFRAHDRTVPLWLECYLAWTFLFLCSFLNNYPWTFEKNSVFNKLWVWRVGPKQKIRGSQVEKLAKPGIESTAVTQKVQQKYRDIACKAKFFSPFSRQAAKIYVATPHKVVRQETIEIYEQRTAFVWYFAEEVDRCLKDCLKQSLQTTVSMNLSKIFAGHTGDRFDVKTASIRTTEPWDFLKSFILTSLKLRWLPTLK